MAQNIIVRSHKYSSCFKGKFVPKPIEYVPLIIYTYSIKINKFYYKGDRKLNLRVEIIEKIQERLTEIFGEAEYTENTTFESLGMKSVNYSQLTTALEDEFDIEVPYMDFKRRLTIGTAADYIVELVEG